MVKNKNETSFERLSLYVKLAIAGIGGLVGVIAAFGLNSGKAELIYLSVMVIFFEIMVFLFDKLKSEVTSKVDDLHDSLKLNFEYHGLLDSPKTDFNANEVRELWPLLMNKAQKEFWGVNYLSYEYWTDYKGNNLVPIIGQRMYMIKNGSAKRLFVMDSINEVDEWQQIIRLHIDHHFEVKWILFDDFNILVEEFCQHSHMISKTVGFNIIDSENPGIVVDWHYEGRKTDGAKLLRGARTANEYAKLFIRLWDSSKTNEFGNIK